jgi:Rv2525c-like, glycoside hydrolase-like domain
MFGRRRRRRVGVAVLAAVVCSGVTGAGAAAPRVPESVFSGYGFESCSAPSIEALDAWLASPYRAVGIYIGGVNRTCANAGLTADWVVSARTSGWSLIPTYVGLQAPCITDTRRARFTAANAQSQGRAAADDAVERAALLGLPAGSPIYYDMEAYALKDPACTRAVVAFVSAWVSELHARGFVAGVYGSAASTGRDMQLLGGTPSGPDDLWIGNWNGNESVFGDPYVSDTLWTDHQRIHQYRGDHTETYGGVSIDIDSDYVDGAVVSPSTTAAPAFAPIATRSASTDDGKASASWPINAFGAEADVALSHFVPDLTLPDYGSGGYGVELEVTTTETHLPVRTLLTPLTLRFAPRQSHLAPVYSTNGTVWKRVPRLVGETLEPGAKTGWSLSEDGGFVIQTTVAGSFALVPDRNPPSAPASVTARFVDAALALSWSASTDRNGPIAGYRVTVTNVPIAALAPGVHHGTVAGFHRHVPSVYRVVAVDVAGNQSRPSKPIVVLPTARPRNLPKAIPAWAWRLLRWQQAGHSAARPAAPRFVPDWYWRWAAWQRLPFHLRRST